MDEAENGTPDGIEDKTIRTGRSQSRTSDLCLRCGAVRPDEGHVCNVVEPGDGTAAVAGAGAALSEVNWVGVIVGNHYQILSLIGRGGMSTVFKARHQMLKKMVALKILTPQFRVDQQKLLRFQQEAISVGRLDHPNIIKIYEFDVPDEGEPYLVMDYVDGRSLADDIALKPLPLSRALNIFKQICRGISHAHKMGVIHRDLKPSNIMISAEKSAEKNQPISEQIKIVDFGIAKILTPEIPAIKLTQTGEIFGSPLYMSPEQCMGKSPDARSDIYSMGCLIFETLTGKPPYEGNNVLETIHLHMYGVPPLTTTLVPSLAHSEVINTIILRCLAKNPGDRYQTMEEVSQALEQIDIPGKENFLQRMILSWQLHNLMRNSTRHGNWPVQIGITVIAITVFATAFLIWQNSGVTLKTGIPSRKTSIDSSIQSTDTEIQNLFVSTSIAGQKLFDDGHLNAAKKLFLDFVDKKMSPEEENLLKAQTYVQLADLEYVAGRIAESDHYLLKAKDFQKAAVAAPYNSALLQLKELEAKKKMNEDIFDNLNDEARVCEEFQAPFKAKEILEKTLAIATDERAKDESATKDIATKRLPLDSGKIARTEKNLAHVYFTLGELEKAHEYYERALKIRLVKPGYYQLDAIVTLKDAAELDIAMNNFEEAHTYLDQGIHMMRNNANLNNWIMADLHVLRAKVFEHLDTRDGVISELRAAQSIYSVIPLQNDVYQEKADFLMHWAKYLLRDDKKSHEALQSLQEAVRLYEQAPLKSNMEFVSVLKRLAQVYREIGTPELSTKAEALDKRAGAIQRRIDSLTRAH